MYTDSPFCTEVPTVNEKLIIVGTVVDLENPKMFLRIVPVAAGVDS